MPVPTSTPAPTTSVDIDALFAADGEHPPHERSLPWQETRDGMTVIVEPRPHWASDMCAFREDAQEYCRYVDWCENGPRARFYGHAEIRGDDVMMKARAEIAREAAAGLWDQF